ncbi:endolysin [Escherichia phage Dru_SM1]
MTLWLSCNTNQITSLFTPATGSIKVEKVLLLSTLTTGLTGNLLRSILLAPYQPSLLPFICSCQAEEALSMALQPRGIRNNNPGNIRWGDNWQGLVPADKRTDKSFAQFTQPIYGIRALAKILTNYTKREGLPNVGKKNIDTVREIIARWAPPNENDTEAYIRSVAKAIGVQPNDPINVFDKAIMSGLVKAIIRHENGMMPYTDDVINRAIAMVL